MNTLIAGSNGMAWMIILVLLLGAVTGFAYRVTLPGTKVLTESLAEPLDGAQTATVMIHADDGNLIIDRLSSGEPLLAGGTLQYLEKQGPPSRTRETSGDQAQLTLQGGEAAQPWFRLPWAACNSATEWRIQLNPAVQYALTAHSGGGNVKLDLAGLRISRVVAGTGGGNMDVVLPDHAANMNIAAKTGAGNVTVVLGSGLTGSSLVEANSGAGNVVVYVPSGIAAKVNATSGIGKVIIDPHFVLIGDSTYQSSDYDDAVNRVEITAHSGAGNVNISRQE